MRKIKTAIVLLGIVLSTGVLAGCHATFSTPSGLREHHRGVNGGLSIAKAENDKTEEYHKTQRETDYNALQSLANRMAAEASGS